MGWRAVTWMDLGVGEWLEDHYQQIEIWSVRIENERGKRLVYIGPLAHGTQSLANALADRINQHIAANPQWAPRDKHWEPTYPVYGSEEYQASGEEANWAAQERAMAELKEIYDR